MINTVTVGMIGSGFAAHLHAVAYQRVFGIVVNFKAVASLDPKVTGFAAEYGIKDIYSDYHEMLRDPELDVIDIVTPPSAHTQMIIDAMDAGKHVICEKPLTACFETQRDGKSISCVEMFNTVTEQLQRLQEKVLSSKKQFMYAENWIYFPSVAKADMILSKRGGKILMIKGDESHSGSHAEHAAYWKYNGGGSLIRQGCHPLSAAIYFKLLEAKRRGEEMHVKSVMCDAGMLSTLLTEEEHGHIAAHPVDVEDTATTLMTFSDGTKASIFAADIVLGGIHNYIELCTSDAVYQCHVAPSPEMQAYFADDNGMKDVYLAEKLENKMGWQFIASDEDFARGYHSEMQDFMECVVENRMPKSGFRLAYESIRAIYASYASAETGRRIEL